jgi:hypothetical protein
MLKRFFVIPVLATLVLAPLSVRADSRDMLPDSWGGKLAVGYENRAESNSEPGDPATGTGNPRFWYTEPEDILGIANLWAKWKLRPFRQASRIKLEYERQEWMEGEILGRNLLTLELRQGLSKRSRLELEVEYAPQVYVRHRSDKDAEPGEARFRPEAYRETEVELAYRYSWPPRELHTTILANYTVRDMTRWFNERDRKRVGGGLSLDLPLSGRTRIKPEYQFRVNTSRNEPDLGRDLSYREHVLELRLATGGDWVLGPWGLDVQARLKLRHYTTDNPEDTRRYRRNEQTYYWDVKLKRRVGPVTPFASWQAFGRWVDVPGNVETVDEDGEIDRSLLQIGLEWES